MIDMSAPATAQSPAPAAGGHAAMTRSEIRQLKQAVRTGNAPDASEQDASQGRASASALLERSIQCGHRRLAVIRLAEAVRTGAMVTPSQWHYCEGVIARTGNEALRQLVLDAIDRRAQV